MKGSTNTRGGALTDAGWVAQNRYHTMLSQAIRVATFALLVVSVSNCRPAPPPEESIIHLGLPDRVNSTPSLAASGNDVALAWGASDPTGQTDVFVAVSRDAGETFAAPVRVNDRAGLARLGGELPPKIAIAPGTAGPEIAVAWTEKGSGVEIRFARSRDGGRTFAPAVSMQSTGSSGDRGWPALALDDRRDIHAVWLDHRGLVTDTPAAAPKPHAHTPGSPGAQKHDGVAMAQKSGLYYASTQSGTLEEREIAKGVCYCCKTALAFGRDGSLFAAWRHVYPGNIRDIALSVSRDAGRTFGAPVRVSDDQWQLDGCPDDGPAMVLDEEGTAHIVWATVIGGSEPEGALFYASTRDGQVITPRQRIPTLGSPRPGHPQITVAGPNRLVVAWDELHDGTRKVVVRELERDQKGVASFKPPHVLNGTTVGLYPVLATTPHGVLAAWTSGAETTRIAVARIKSDSFR